MTPTRRPAAKGGRLLAHGLGLGLLAGGVVLGVQDAAQALQYVFADGSGDTSNGLQLSFTGNFGLGGTESGTGRVTGRFDISGTTVTILEAIAFTVITSNGLTANATFAVGAFRL